MKAKKFVAKLGVLLMCAGVVSPVMPVHADDNIDKVKEFIELDAKYDDANYYVDVKQPCYLMGVGTDDSYYSSCAIDGRVFFEEIPDMTYWVSKFPDSGFSGIVDYLVQANEIINYSSYEDVTEEEYNNAEDKEIYTVLGDYYSDSEGNVIMLGEYNSLSDEDKSKYSYIPVSYKKPVVLSYIKSIPVSQIGADLSLQLNDISVLYVYDTDKHYVGSVDVATMNSIYSENIADFTTSAGVSVDGYNVRYVGQPVRDKVELTFNNVKLAKPTDYLIATTVTKNGTDNVRTYYYNIGGNITDEFDAGDYTVHFQTNDGASYDLGVHIGGVDEGGIGAISVSTDSKPAVDNTINTGVSTVSGVVTTAPQVDISGIPESTTDESITVTVTSDIPAMLSFNGINSEGNVTSATFTVNANGIYQYSATTDTGLVSSKLVNITCFTSADADISKNTSASQVMSFNPRSSESLKVVDGASAETVLSSNSEKLPQSGVTGVLIACGAVAVAGGGFAITKGVKKNAKKD